MRVYRFAGLFVGVLTAVSLSAAPAASPKLKLSTDRVVIFKDGHGLVVKSASATADADGMVFTTEVPDGAVLGAFWAISKEKKILAMRAEWDEKKEIRPRQTPALTVAELLRANLGKTVTLELVDKSEKGVAFTQVGTLSEMLETPAELSPTRRGEAFDPSGLLPTGPVTYTTAIREDGVVTVGGFTPESLPDGGTLVRELAPRGGELIVLTQETGHRTVIPVASIKSVFGDKNLITTVTRQEEVFSKTKRLSFDFGKESADKPVSLTLFYFTAGLRWIPTYRVSGDLKDSADLALQGELLNEVTDIDHAQVDLVVGVPNFRFKDTVSPLTLERAMRRVAADAINSNGGTLTLGNNNQQMLNANFDNNSIVLAGRGRENAAEGLAPELGGASGEQDLFVYSLKDFSLKKGARATAPLWQQSAALRHLYTFDIQHRRSRVSGGIIDKGGSGDSSSPLQITMNHVWHQLELSNTGKVPWTTGAALMLRESLPIGQDLLTYTPPSSKALLPVTIAVDLRGTFDEQETDRKPNALHFDGYDFFIVKKKGTVTVTSFRKDKSDMRITLSTGGKVTTVSDDGKIKLNDFHTGDWDEPGYMRVNNHSDLVWEFTLEPGATKTLSYETSLYVR